MNIKFGALVVILAFLASQIVGMMGAQASNLAINDQINLFSLSSDYLMAPPQWSFYVAQSNFFQNDDQFSQISNGQSYSMPQSLKTKVDPTLGWVYDKDIYGYKLLSAFNMLGYNTYNSFEKFHDDYLDSKEHLYLLHLFQKQYGFTESDVVNSKIIQKIDQLLATRESWYAQNITNFPVDHLKSMHPNDVPKEVVAFIINYPLQALPKNLRMDSYEMLQFFASSWGGGGGKLLLNGKEVQIDLDNRADRVNPNSNYIITWSMFKSEDPTSQMYPATSPVITSLHEYGHYLDGYRAGYFHDQNPQSAMDIPHAGIIDTYDFYQISFNLPADKNDINIHVQITPKTNDVHDFITWYAASALHSKPADQKFLEDFAESFAYYVTSGAQFRAAATQNSIVAKKYDWLKNNVFHGIEYDTNCISLDSGVGYMTYADDYIWNGKLLFLKKYSMDSLYFYP